MSSTVSSDLLAWYDRHRRRLPWRAEPGERTDPYRVWLSEIMLQQTTVQTVGPYFQAFTERWPTVRDLAASPLDDVLVAWAGLGYYARARNLHKCAVTVADQYGGAFPDTEAELKALPGIGDYTAAAIAAIAFDRPAAVLDGNIERVMARLFAVTAPLPGCKPELRRLVGTLVPKTRSGDFAQALMDLGAGVCTPTRPKCILCPLAEGCDGRRQGIAADLPRKAPKKDKPTRRAVAFWLTLPSGDVLLRRRPEKGLLGGMMEIPSSAWVEQPMPDLEAAAPEAPAKAFWRLLDGMVRHTFTHFHLELHVAHGRAPSAFEVEDGRWVPLDQLGDQALPTVMRKVARHAITRRR